MSYPSTIATLTNPLATQKLNAPSHSGIETSQNTEITAVETFIGVEGSASTVGTLIYDVRSPASNGGGHVQTANKGGTGQTNFQKGDILVAQSTSVLSKLAIGTNGQFLTANSATISGVTWGGNVDIQTFSVNGVWTKPLGAKLIVVTGIGMGGKGGDGGANNPNSFGGGGGGGAIDSKSLFPNLITSSVAVIIGTGAATSVATAFGAYFSVAGGLPGSAGNNPTGGAGGAGAPGGATGISGGAGASGGSAGTGPSGGGGGAAGGDASASTGGKAGVTDSDLGIGANGVASMLTGLRGSVYGAGSSGSGGGINSNVVGPIGAPGLLTVITYL